MALTPPPGVDGDSAAGVLARAEANLTARRAALVEELLVGLTWADLHGEPPATEVPGGDRLVRLGGDGTPRVRDLCLEELSIARRVHVANTRALLADALDLRHRLPRMWSAVQRLECETWLARKVARMSRRLDREQVGLVDVAVAAAIHQAPSRLLAIAEAKVIEADTAAHEAELAAQAEAHGVWLGRLRPTDPDDPESGRGTRSLYAKLSPAGVHWLDQTIDELADLFAAEEGLRAEYAPALAELAADLPEGEEPCRDQCRAAALELLGRPDQAARLLGLLGPLDQDDGNDDEEASRPANPRRATVYVHLHEAALLAGEGVARAEAVGPVLVSHLRRLVGHAEITLRPVIDLTEVQAVNGYEHPTSMRERARLRLVTGDVFPYAVSLGRYGDHDHVVPFDPGGPPGQTSDTNLAPLTRRSHRAKTHAGHHVEQLGLGQYLWRSPHGLWTLVDATGSHPLGDAEARMLRWIHTQPKAG